MMRSQMTPGYEDVAILESINWAWTFEQLAEQPAEAIHRMRTWNYARSQAREARSK